MPYTTNAGVRLHWSEQGPDQEHRGEPLLLIMGHLFSGDMWYPVVPVQAAHRRVIWFDNRGSGRSDATDTATVSDLAADARAVLDAAGVESAHVFGVSMGGGIALQLAHESPERVRSLVLGCTAMRSPTYQVPEVKGPVLGTWRYRVPKWLLIPLMKGSLYGPAASPEAIERDLKVLRTIRYSPRGVRAQDLAIAGYDMTPDKVATITVPTLVQHGTEDRTVQHGEGEQIAATIPGARLISYPGAAHNYLVDATEQANADLTAFLDGVEARLP